MKNKLFILCVFAILSFSCDRLRDRSEDSIYRTKDETEYKDTPLEKPTNDTLPNDKVKKFLVKDFDQDGEQDSLFLSVDVEQDDKGRIAWDDGQKWHVYVKHQKDFKILYGEFVQLGKLELYYDNTNNLIYLVENIPNRNRKFKIDPKRNYKLERVEAISDYTNLDDLKIE